jgi:sulfur-oxidizing protein SoxY
MMTRAKLLPLKRRALLVTAALSAVGRHAAAQGAAAQQDAWPSLAAQIFERRPLQDGSAILAIDAPYRAEDASLVPVDIHSVLPASGSQRIRSITLVIDENPSPLAAIFSLGDGSGTRTLSTRVRVDAYTNLHAVADLSDGQLYAAARFIKAAGGCSAPAAKQDADSIPLGTMRLRLLSPARDTEPGLHEAVLMIRHPNYSGMQMDQLTRLYVPASFVRSVRIWQGDDLLLGIEGGISLAENPQFRFDYHPNGASRFRAELEDSEGRSFRQEWPATPA